MAPTEEHAATVEIRDGQCRSRCRPHRAQAEVGVQQETDAENGVVQRQKDARTMIDIVVAKPHIIMHKHNGYHQIDDGSYYQGQIVKGCFHITAFTMDSSFSDCKDSVFLLYERQKRA